MLPGKAVSPGNKTCSFVTAPGLTVREGVVLDVFVGSEISDAVRVVVTAVLRVTLSVLMPEERDDGTGSDVKGSEEVRLTVSVALVTRFQLASTALAVTLKAVPAVRAMGVPVLPEAVPGARVP